MNHDYEAHFMNEIEENIFQKDTFPKVGGLYEGHKFESTFLEP